MTGYVPGTRNAEAEFETATHQVVDLSTDLRPDAVSFDYLVAYSMGPIALGDADEGAYVRAWKARADNTLGKVFVARANDANDGWEAETDLFTYFGDPIVELDLAFEQAGRAFIAAERADGHVWFFWYDPTLIPPDFTFQDFGVGRTPRCLLDNPADTTDSDVLAFYIIDGQGIVYRHQRDRYAAERSTPWLIWDNIYLEEAAKSTDNRVVLILSSRDEGTDLYELLRRETTLYPVIVLDEPYTAAADILSGALVSAILESAPAEEKYTIAAVLVGGALATALINHVCYDIDQYTLASAILATSALVVVVIEHDVYDPHDYQAATVPLSGLLVVVVINHVCYDIDTYQAAAVVQGGSLVTA